MNRTIKIKNNHLAIVIEVPAITPNPNNPATIATIRKNIAQANQPPTPFLLV